MAWNAPKQRPDPTIDHWDAPDSRWAQDLARGATVVGTWLFWLWVILVGIALGLVLGILKGVLGRKP